MSACIHFCDKKGVRIEGTKTFLSSNLYIYFLALLSASKNLFLSPAIIFFRLNSNFSRPIWLAFRVFSKKIVIVWKIAKSHVRTFSYSEYLQTHSILTETCWMLSRTFERTMILFFSFDINAHGLLNETSCRDN